MITLYYNSKKNISVYLGGAAQTEADYRPGDHLLVR